MDDLIKNFEQIITEIGASKNLINIILFLFSKKEGARVSEISKFLGKKKQNICTNLYDLISLGIVKKIISPISHTVVYKLENGNSLYRGVMCYVSYFYFCKYPEKREK